MREQRELELLLDEEALDSGKKALASLAEAYFKPRPFERKIYERIGIRLFTRYWPNGGSHFSFSGSLLKGRKSKDLQELINVTKIIEATHTLAEPVLVYNTINLLSEENYFLNGLGVLGVLASVLNLYSICAQRYNRSRAISIQEKNKERNKKSQY